MFVEQKAAASRKKTYQVGRTAWPIWISRWLCYAYTNGKQIAFYYNPIAPLSSRRASIVSFSALRKKKRPATLNA
ncbi:hypothetical protein BRO54_0877 [Geobacillus proteiniphilus]|uniref:Uncharacterized protein n=1 Tax=Geobacillus proteiniphilus TaxID=860353 RepID=A0A1Q5T5E2_9BACL|nr:hypothetical protein BRO54_0877 [Geobacillus proteiniphilus]